MLGLAGCAGLFAGGLGAWGPAAGADPELSRVALCRDAWGARPARPGGIPQVPDRLTIHHTEVVLGDNSNAPGRLRQHQRYHQDAHGWIDIAYHYSVDRNGNIYELRNPGLVGDTATNYDPTNHFLVVCEGDFDREEITEAQLDGAAFVFAWAAQRYGIPINTLRGHRDLSSGTTCPGASLYAHVASGDLTRRVDALSASGVVSLASVCGAQATALVAEIVSGAR
jgi:N-acetylmuramoyl-L-alanine amidase